jgi:hypothetical protein
MQTKHIFYKKKKIYIYMDNIARLSEDRKKRNYNRIEKEFDLKLESLSVVILIYPIEQVTTKCLKGAIITFLLFFCNLLLNSLLSMLYYYYSSI